MGIPKAKFPEGAVQPKPLAPPAADSPAALRCRGAAEDPLASSEGDAADAGAAYDVFISYSSKDHAPAQAVLEALEREGLRCWIAPRDIRPGDDWGSSIVAAIEDSRVMVLLFTASANGSQQVMREVERAVHKGVIVVPMRIEDVPLSRNMEYFISASHWLDAFEGPIDGHVTRLVTTVRAIIDENGAERPPGRAGRRRWRGWRLGLAVTGAAALLALCAVGALFLAVVYSSSRLGDAATAGQGLAQQTQPAAADGATAGPDSSKLFRQLQAAWVGTVYKYRASQERAARAETQPALRQPPATRMTPRPPDPAVFVTVPQGKHLVPYDCPADARPADPAGDDRGVYTVVVDYTHPNGAESLRHGYLRLLTSSNGAQSIMYYNLEEPQQWAGEGSHLHGITATREPIQNGYRVTFRFRIDGDWANSSDVNLDAWGYDWDNFDGPHTDHFWHADYRRNPALPSR